MELFEAIESRRSYSVLVEPAPNKEQLTQILRAAAFAPDHKELRPWRFIVLEQDKKQQLGKIMAESLVAKFSDATPGQIEKEQNKPTRAPLIVVVAAIAKETRLPFDELYASACAATQNMLLATTALGFGAIWRSGDAVYDPSVKAFLQLEDKDAIAGFVYIGSPKSDASPRSDVDLDEIVSW